MSRSDLPSAKKQVRNKLSAKKSNGNNKVNKIKKARLTAGNPIGRAPKLSKKIQASICAYMAKGFSIEDACIVSGINKTSYYNWRDKGNIGLSKTHVEFLNATDRARLKFEETYLDQIAIAATQITEKIKVKQIKKGGPDGEIVGTEVISERMPPNWQAALALLKIARPGKYAAQTTAIVGGETESGSDSPSGVRIIFDDGRSEKTSKES